MKKIIAHYTIVLSIFFVFACNKTNPYQYTGEYPKWNYTLPNIKNPILADINGNEPNKVLFRNRIYITINEKNEILVNNNKINRADFNKVFEYIYTNPDKLDYLPESEEKVIMLFINNSKTNHLGKPSFSYGLHLIIDDEILFKINTIIESRRENYISNLVNKEVSDSILAAVELKFPLTIAYSIKKTNTKASALDLLNTEENSGDTELKPRNIIQVLVNANDEVLIRNEYVTNEMIKSTVKKMILNLDKDVEFPENTKNAIILYRNERNTDYELYKNVRQKLSNAYLEIRNERSIYLFGHTFDSLNTEYQKLIRKEIPLMIVEGEPNI